MNHPEPTELDGQSPAVEPDLGGDPLFAPKEARPKGSELRSWQQLVDLYGGECGYQLTALCGKTLRYTAKSERLYLSGPARKLRGKRRSEP